MAEELKAKLTLCPASEKTLGGRSTTKSLVNGHAATAVYTILSRSDRRQHGIFFSGDEWAKKITQHIPTGNWQRYIDPSAGVGDLLLEICKTFPLGDSFSATQLAWSKLLSANDLRLSFIEIAWTRIQALAVSRHQLRGDDLNIDSLIEMPPSFQTGDTLSKRTSFLTGDCLVMNPPFQRIKTPPDSAIGTGLYSAAALHLERIIAQAEPGVGIVALVPDVLRSGSSYKKFRALLNSKLDIREFIPLGRFGASADVDVSLISGITSKARTVTSSRGTESFKSTHNIGENFKVRVGSVVPHRTSSAKSKLGYINVKNTPAWAELERIETKASYLATAEQGPFVVIRRTSSPSDKERARATVINTKEMVLVENHFIICKPLSGLISDCRKLVANLKDKRTNQWLNQRIRCRHLTVSAVSELPWWED